PHATAVGCLHLERRTQRVAVAGVLEFLELRGAHAQLTEGLATCDRGSLTDRSGSRCLQVLLSSLLLLQASQETTDLLDLSGLLVERSLLICVDVNGAILIDLERVTDRLDLCDALL